MLATLRRLPPRGSAQSYVLQALLLRKDQIEYSRTRALVQAIVNKDAADEALKSYSEAQMPYLVRIKRDDRNQHIKRLMAEVARGAMSITPVMQKQVKSKLKTRVVERDQVSKEEQLQTARRISKKVGGYA